MPLPFAVAVAIAVKAILGLAKPFGTETFICIYLYLLFVCVVGVSSYFNIFKIDINITVKHQLFYKATMEP